MAVLSMTLTFAENEELNTVSKADAYKMTVNYSRLADALAGADEGGIDLARAGATASRCTTVMPCAVAMNWPTATSSKHDWNKEP